MKKIKLKNKLLLKKEVIHLHLIKGGITDPNIEDEYESDDLVGKRKKAVLLPDLDRS